MTDVSRQSHDVLIIGDGIAAWTSALLLKQLRPESRVGVISSVAGSLGEEEVLLARPEARQMLRLLDISEAELIGECDASFLTGMGYRGWGAPEAEFMLAWGAYGAPAGGAGFHHYYQRMKEAGSVTRYDAFSIGAQMARHGKFIHPAENPKALESSFDYGYLIDAKLWAALVRHRARAKGVTERSAPLREIIWESGQIAGLSLADDSLLAADLYIETSDQGAGNVSWQAWADAPAGLSRSIESHALPQDNLSCSFTTVTSNGWQSESALQSRHIVETVKPAPATAMAYGHLAAPWQGNCLRIGAAACRMPPLHWPTFTLLARELTLLSGLLPADRVHHGVEAREYNRRSLETYARLRDFQVLFDPARRGVSPPASEALLRKMEQFTSRGRLVMYDEETITESEWTAALIGLGRTPERISPLALPAPLETVHQSYQRLLQKLTQSVERMPSQQVYLAHMKRMLAEQSEGASPDAV